jgi:hypothetical protein
MYRITAKMTKLTYFLDFDCPTIMLCVAYSASYDRPDVQFLRGLK